MLYSHIKDRYSSIITLTKSLTNRYEVIDFEKFISFHLGINNVFLPEGKPASIRELLKSKKINEKTAFTETGIIIDIPFNQLHYYQVEVGIDGPKNTSINEPVNIFLFEGKYILWNGYHRAFRKISEGQQSISGYVLQLQA